MVSLSYPSPAELRVRLEAQDGAILDVIRGCPWWTEAEIDGRTPGTGTVTGVTLTALRANDSTLRRILLLSFNLEFPADGGVGQLRTKRSR